MSQPTAPSPEQLARYIAGLQSMDAGGLLLHFQAMTRQEHAAARAMNYDLSESSQRELGVIRAELLRRMSAPAAPALEPCWNCRTPAPSEEPCPRCGFRNGIDEEIPD